MGIQNGVDTAARQSSGAISSVPPVPGSPCKGRSTCPRGAHSSPRGQSSAALMADDLAQRVAERVRQRELIYRRHDVDVQRTGSASNTGST